jgi:hypothetical protein
MPYVLDLLAEVGITVILFLDLEVERMVIQILQLVIRRLLIIHDPELNTDLPSAGLDDFCFKKITLCE